MRERGLRAPEVAPHFCTQSCFPYYRSYHPHVVPLCSLHRSNHAISNYLPLLIWVIYLGLCAEKWLWSVLQAPIAFLWPNSIQREALHSLDMAVTKKEIFFTFVPASQHCLHFRLYDSRGRGAVSSSTSTACST